MYKRPLAERVNNWFLEGNPSKIIPIHPTDLKELLSDRAFKDDAINGCPGFNGHRFRILGSDTVISYDD